ncbi:MAG: GDP-mannose 4,6-dehydratase [Chloroflexaceae bacterium]|nr:GDP-mannose 4,6-dehydratase [Chloroflexaceae bacterium]
MRVLVTGINGFVGGHLAEHLLSLGGWEVWGVARQERHRLSHLREYVRLIPADVGNPSQVSEAILRVRPQAIFHLAGQAFVPESFQDPATTLTTNLLSLLYIFQALLSHHLAARVLVVGSYEVYGQVDPNDLPIDEATPLRPTSPYGVSKVAQDMLALQYHLSHHLDVVRVRPFNHIGPRQNERFVASAFARQIALVEKRLLPPVISVGNLNAQRDFTDVRDMVRAYRLAVERGEAGQVYNIGSGQPVTIRDMLDHLLAASHVEIAVQNDPQRMRPIDVPTVVCDARRFRAQTGWEPQIALSQTLQDLMQDWRGRVQNGDAGD